jgi:hypothetical protein
MTSPASLEETLATGDGSRDSSQPIELAPGELVDRYVEHEGG